MNMDLIRELIYYSEPEMHDWCRRAGPWGAIFDILGIFLLHLSIKITHKVQQPVKFLILLVQFDNKIPSYVLGHSQHY